MLLIRTAGLTVKTKYYVKNNNIDYYQRAIPLRLRKFFNGAKTIKRRLWGNQYSLQAEIIKFAKQDDQLFADALKKSNDKTFNLELEAKTILARNGVSPGEGLIHAEVFGDLYDQPHLDLIEDYLRERKEKGAMSEADKLAEHLLRKPMPMSLSRALDFYLDNHKNSKVIKFRRDKQKHYKHLYDIFGDAFIEQLKRADARTYIVARSRHVKTSTIKRELNSINAVLNFTIREMELNISNPFVGIPIGGLGEDSKPRKPLSIEEHKLLIKVCIGKQDEMRIILLVLLTTGMRLSEALGLRVSDIRLEAAVPHLTLEEYGLRTLKTKNSVRLVPLIPTLQSILKTYISGLTSDILFPQYNNGIEILNNNASGALNKYIRSHEIDKTCHSARHSIRDLLREADIPDSIIDEIGGWSKQNIGAYYGKGFSLEKKYNALTKALAKVIS
jgi:integrase